VRAREFLLEERRNPEINTRVDGWDQFLSIYRNIYNRDGNTNNLYVSLTEIEKLGINPNSPHETPQGIYAYPAAYVLKQGSFKRLPYAGEQQFINVFTVKPQVNIIRLDTMSSTEANGYIQQMVEFYLNRYPEQQSRINEILSTGAKNAYSDDQGYLGPNGKALRKSPGGKLWFISYQLVDENVSLWNKLFRSAGIDGAIDNGLGIIHYKEPTQIVFFNPTAIQMISRFPNTIYNQTSSNNKREQGIERTSIKRQINGMSEKEQIELIQQEPNNLTHIRNPSFKVQKAAISKSPYYIKAINNPSIELLQYAVKLNPVVLSRISNPPVELQLYAVGLDPWNISYIKNPAPATIQSLSPEFIQTITQEVAGMKEHGLDTTQFNWINQL